MRTRVAGAVVAVALAATQVGCPGTHYARSLTVAPDGVAIAERDGVSLRAGELIAAPSEWVRGRMEGIGLCFERDGTLPATEPFEEDGLAHRESVTYLTIGHPSMPPGETLYGALVLCHLSDRAPTSVQQLYRLEIPAEFVEATTEGRRAFVSETYVLEPEGFRARAWALWIQRTPFR